MLQDHWRPCAFSAMAMYEIEPFEANHDTVMLFDVQEEFTFTWVGGHAAGGVKQNQSDCLHYHRDYHKK